MVSVSKKDETVLILQAALKKCEGGCSQCVLQTKYGDGNYDFNNLLCVRALYEIVDSEFDTSISVVIDQISKNIFDAQNKKEVRRERICAHLLKTIIDIFQKKGKDYSNIYYMVPGFSFLIKKYNLF